VGNETVDVLQGKMKKIVDLGAKLTLADRTEEFVRFVAARTADNIFSAAGFEGMDLQQPSKNFCKSCAWKLRFLSASSCFSRSNWTSNGSFPDLSV